MLKTTFTAAAILFATGAAAETIRFTFDTEADLSRTLANNSWSQNEAGSYAGIITTTTGLNAAVTGYIDIERIGGIDSVAGFALNVVTPHGVAPGFGIADYSAQFFSEFTTSSATGGTANLDPNGVLYINQVFQFDPFYGPKVGGSYSPTPYYDPNVRAEEPFMQAVQLLRVVGAGPNGEASYKVNRVDFSCYEFPNGGGGASGCNGYYLGNSGTWDNGSGLAATFGPAPSGSGPTGAVPLPAGLPLLLAALGGLGLLGRRRAG